MTAPRCRSPVNVVGHLDPVEMVITDRTIEGFYVYKCPRCGGLRMDLQRAPSMADDWDETWGVMRRG